MTVLDYVATLSKNLETLSLLGVLPLVFAGGDFVNFTNKYPHLCLILGINDKKPRTESHI
jgi:hypothetical protein